MLSNFTNQNKVTIETGDRNIDSMIRNAMTR